MKIHRTLTLMTALFTLATTSYGATCTEINNLDHVVSFDTVRNQGDIGWCYAYAAADLVGKKISTELSPRDFASSYNDGGVTQLFQILTHEKEYEIEGGFIHTAMRRALNRGVCEYSRLPDAADGQIKGRMKQLDEIYVDIHKKFPQGTNASTIANYLKSNNLITYQIRDFFPELSDLDFAKILSTESALKYYDKLVETSCYGYRISPSEKIRYRNHNKIGGNLFSDIFFNKVDEYLEDGKIVGISYYASVLLAPADKKSGNHASSIVARRTNPKNNQCEYLIRNSWGTGCYAYPDQFSCQDGHIWIPRDLIKNAVYKLTIIRD